MTVETTDRSSGMQELRDRIEGLKFAMVTLPAPDGQLRGRPLTVQDVEFDGSFWFLVSRSSSWTSGLRGTERANVALTDPSDQRWVSVSGAARLVEDPARVRDMWSPFNEAWFDGVDDPDVTLLQVAAEVADYWDGSSSRIVQWARIANAVITKEPPDEGDRGTVRP